MENICKTKFKYFNELFSQFHKKVVLLTGQMNIDLKALEKSDIIISSPETWDVVSRRWKQRKAVQSITVFIVDELHLMSHANSVLEVITSRMRYMSTQLEKHIRIVGLATSVANYKSISEWIGTNANFSFNFHPKAMSFSKTSMFKPLAADTFIYFPFTSFVILSITSSDTSYLFKSALFPTK